MTNYSDIMLGTDDDLVIEGGDLAIGDCLTQEVGIILRLNPGELKSDPLLGPGLIRLTNSKVNDTELQTLVKLHLARDGKNYDDIKNLMAIKANRL